MDQRKGDHVVPLERCAKEQIGDHGEHTEGDAFLQDLQLHQGKCLRTEAVRRHLKHIFKERHQPTDQNHPHERLVSVPKMTIPRNGHKDVGHDE